MEKIHLKKLILHLWGGGRIQVGVFVRGEAADGRDVSGGGVSTFPSSGPGGLWWLFQREGMLWAATLTWLKAEQIASRLLQESAKSSLENSDNNRPPCVGRINTNQPKQVSGCQFPQRLWFSSVLQHFGPQSIYLPVKMFQYRMRQSVTQKGSI